jgi:hypothetical protein
MRGLRLQREASPLRYGLMTWQAANIRNEFDELEKVRPKGEYQSPFPGRRSYCSGALDLDGTIGGHRHGRG